MHQFVLQGREDSNPVDIPRSYSLPQIHVCQRRMELWDCSMGGDVLWRETILGDVQSGCKYL